MNSRTLEKVPAAVWPVISAMLFLGIWSLMAYAQLVPAAVLPGPGAVFNGLAGEASSGRLLAHVASSAVRLLVGFAIGATVGVLLGGLLGSFRPLRHALNPVIELLRPIPPLAWIPLALIWFGINEPSKWFLIALTVSFPVIVATMRGIEATPLNLIRAARMMDVGRVKLLFQVLLPSAAPDVITGLRLGWTLGITILVGAEMIAASSGLGFMIMDGMNTGRFDLVIGGILVLGALSVATDGAFGLLVSSKLLRWQSGPGQDKKSN